MFNQFTGIGRLAADCDTRYTQGGTQVTNITVCCEYGYGDNKKTEFVKCTIWDKLANIADKYLHKGSMVMIQGPMETRKYQDRDGVDRYSTSIIVRELKMLSPKSEQRQGSRQDDGQGHTTPTTGEDAPF